jgi:PKD repeat protein
MSKNLILIWSALLLLESCVKKTEACFTYSPEAIDVNDVVTFDASCSQSASFFYWNFGDLTVDTSNNSHLINYSFDEPGVYEVNLKVIRKDGITLGKDNYSIKKTIVVN